jgi:hypothetical protein
MPIREEWEGSYAYNGPYVGFTPMDSGEFLFHLTHSLFEAFLSLSLSLSLSRIF